MAILQDNINQVNSDFNGIKTAITANGVEVADGTATSEYADKVNEVYEAGRQSMFDDSGTVEKTVTGKMVCIRDVSELPHEIKVKLTSDTITDFSGVTVIKNGSNLLNPKTSNSYTTVDENGVIYINNTSSAEIYPTSPWSLLKAGIYTVVVDKYEGEALNVYLQKGSSDDYATQFVMSAGACKLIKTVVLTQDVNCRYMITPHAKGTFRGTIQVNYESPVAYEPYYAESIKANADGTVEGLSYIPPNITLTTDNEDMDISVTYYQSRGAVVEQDQFWEAYQWGGKRTTYPYAFYNSYWKDDIFNPKYDFINVSNVYCMFDTSYLTKIDKTIQIAKNPSSINQTFAHMPYLKSIKRLIVNETHAFTNWFLDDTALEDLGIEGVIAQSISLSASSKLNKNSQLRLFNCLSDTATGKTLTLSKTAVNNAFENGSAGDEWLNLVATKPNWTISLS